MGMFVAKVQKVNGCWRTLYTEEGHTEILHEHYQKGKIKQIVMHGAISGSWMSLWEQKISIRLQELSTPYLKSGYITDQTKEPFKIYNTRMWSRSILFRIGSNATVLWRW